MDHYWLIFNKLNKGTQILYKTRQIARNNLKRLKKIGGSWLSARVIKVKIDFIGKKPDFGLDCLDLVE